MIDRPDARDRIESSFPQPELAARAGMEHPRAVGDWVPLVDRAVAFVDLCGFTSFTASNGERAAIDVLRSFRLLTRDIASRRGVVIAKWLGDGAMLVGSDIGPIAATTAELLARYATQTLPLRGGMAHGGVILFEGDDYIGRPVNLAARFCQAARPGELLAVGYPLPVLPEWVEVVGTREVDLHGLGRIRDVQRLAPVSGVEFPTRPRLSATAGP